MHPKHLFAPPAIIVIIFHKDGVDVGNMEDLAREKKKKLKTGDAEVINNSLFLSFSLTLELSPGPPSS